VAKVFVLAFVGALAAGLGATVFFELRGAAGWASGRLIKAAVRLLPESICDEREEEWFAEYEHWKDGAIGRLLWTLGLLVAATQIGRRERRSALVQQPPQPVPPPTPDLSRMAMSVVFRLKEFECAFGTEAAQRPVQD